MRSSLTRSIALGLAVSVLLAVCCAPFLGASAVSAQSGGHGLTIGDTTLVRTVDSAGARNTLELGLSLAGTLALGSLSVSRLSVVERPRGSAAQSRFTTPLRI